MQQKPESAEDVAGAASGKFAWTLDVYMKRKDLENAHCSMEPPAEVGSFSLTASKDDPYEHRREFHNDRSCMSQLYRRGPYSVVQGLSMPLDKGYNTFIRRKDARDLSQREHVTHMLNWISHHPQEFLAFRPEIVCWRGHLDSIMSSPFEATELSPGWIICACKMDGVIYLTNFDTVKKTQHKQHPIKNQERFEYWGYKFEQYMTHNPKVRGSYDEPVNNFNGFIAVLKRKIGGTRVLFGAETDCMDPLQKDTPAPGCYGELKTTRLLYTDYHKSKFYNHKMCKVWAQCSIAGIPTVIVGYRDDAGVCVSTEEFQTGRIPTIAQVTSEIVCPFCFLRIRTALETPVLNRSMVLAGPLWCATIFLTPF
ncbi:decapping and exoribonuclease protein-like isoform X2 [Paramacrobiotus metropolitanus]|uniref:decapping and exoribonuclease protein-like isoform X2 n=1 Tax=Paramacrobiotus metropolitanus TaxID=2943436 RepID=UPI002445D18D|nr:decapping and exoribonuclease protein-like isoform X2 [Paramacrobiotus metropolitanus]